MKPPFSLSYLNRRLLLAEFPPSSPHTAPPGLGLAVAPGVAELRGVGELQGVGVGIGVLPPPRSYTSTNPFPVPMLSPASNAVY